jgi:hypothetical protein
MSTKHTQMMLNTSSNMVHGDSSENISEYSLRNLLPGHNLKLRLTTPQIDRSRQN